MYIETDLNKIKTASRIKENENFRFRSFLKNTNMKSDKIDSIVHDIYNWVKEKIDCTACANCCTQMSGTLDNNDLQRFTGGLGIGEEDFIKRFLTETEQDEDGKKYEFNSRPCPFLKDKLCTNYDNRPEDCRSYPHIHKKEFRTRLLGVIDNYEICPIVFNVYEELKSVLWRRRNSDRY